MNLRQFVSYAAFPLCLLAISIIFLSLYKILGLPPMDNLLSISKDYLRDYVYLTIFIAALVEGLLVINWYLPGSAVIIIGSVFVRDTGHSVVLASAL